MCVRLILKKYKTPARYTYYNIYYYETYIFCVRLFIKSER